MKERFDPGEDHAMLQGHMDWRGACKVQCGSTGTGEASVAWSIPAELLENLVFQNGGATHRTCTGLDTKQNAKQVRTCLLRLPIVSLFAVVHASEYVSISWHRAQGAFIPKEATGERCIVMCPLEKSWYRGLWHNKKTSERDKEPNLIEAYVSEAPWAYGCLEGRRRKGTILVQQRCQKSAAKAGATSG